MKKLINNFLIITLIAILIINLLMFLLDINKSYADESIIVQGKSNAETIWLTLRQIYGYTDIGTAAIMGNLEYESGLRSNNAENYYVGNNSSGTDDKDVAYTEMMNNNRDGFISGDGATNGSILGGKEKNGYVGYGLAQWTYWNRKALLWDMAHEAGVRIDDIGIQLKVLDYELKNGYKYVRDAIQSTANLTEATTAFLKGFENPADQSESVVTKRTSASIKYYNMFSGKTYSDDTVQIETNCSETVVIKKDGVYLYNAPKTSAMTLATLQNGQVVTRINNSGKYVSDGKILDGIVLVNGKKGFVLRENLNTTDFNNVYKVKTSSGLGVNVRQSKSTSSSRVTGVDEYGLVTVLETSSTLENGYYWYYITAPDGVKGYVPNKFLEKLISDTEPEPNPPIDDPIEEPTVTSEFFKVDETNKIIKMVPATDYNTFKNLYSNVKITKSDGTEVTNGLVGTGNKIIINSKTYTAIKVGDVNGDGTINSADLLRIQKHLLGVISLKDTPDEKAADANADGTINSGDLLKIQKKLLGVSELII